MIETLTINGPLTGGITVGSGNGVTIGSVVTSYDFEAGEWATGAGVQWAEDLQQQQFLTTDYTGRFTITDSGTAGGEVVWNPNGVSSSVVFRPTEQTEEGARAAREREYAQDRAKWRAQELLDRHQTPRQRADYEQLGRFTVRTRRGHRYVIGGARCQNVVRVNRRGKPMRVYCVTVHGGVPLADVLLGQKLMLDHDEDHFLAVARQWPVRFALGVGDLVRKKPGKSTFTFVDAGDLNSIYLDAA